jgi:hypothetical protein
MPEIVITAGKRHAPPRASSMIEALRGLGYTTETAIADIIDNSISAGAKVIELRFVWNNSKSRIELQDDGVGMSDVELDLAMRLGEKNPLEERSLNDLGRFGLGLKTASFSQCRRLTVASIGKNGMHCLRWDLDELARNNVDDGWYILEGPHYDSVEFINPLSECKSGTLVLWEILDRIVTPRFSEQDFLDMIDRVENHLSMTFHRYLENKNLKLIINGLIVKPWDPFLSGHPAKPWHSPIARSKNNEVNVECHVLPHKDGLTNKEFEDAGGPGGWTSQQGFYVYRNERLLLAGSWLGLGRGRSWVKDESHKLARIRLDISNISDADWNIDIRKSTARPPVEIRAWLRGLAEEARNRARKAFAFRGKPIRKKNGEFIIQPWKSSEELGKVSYKIDDSHPAIKSVLDSANELLPLIKAMLRVIEETVPAQRIWLDTTENKEVPIANFESTPSSEVKSILNTLFQGLISKGYTKSQAKEQLLNSEPFNKFPSLFEEL